MRGLQSWVKAWANGWARKWGGCVLMIEFGLQSVVVFTLFKATRICFYMGCPGRAMGTTTQPIYICYVAFVYARVADFIVGVSVAVGAASGIHLLCLLYSSAVLLLMGPNPKLLLR